MAHRPVHTVIAADYIHILPRLIRAHEKAAAGQHLLALSGYMVLGQRLQKVERGRAHRAVILEALAAYGSHGVTVQAEVVRLILCAADPAQFGRIYLKNGRFTSFYGRCVACICDVGNDTKMYPMLYPEGAFF